MSRLRLILILLLLPAVLLGWLTMTQSGLQWAYDKAEFYLPLELQVNEINGRLIGPITVNGLELQQDGALLSAQKITLDWRPAALLSAKINISQLHIQKLNIALSETEATGQDPVQPAKKSLPDIRLPWRLLLKDGQVDGFSISQQGQTFVLNSIKLSASSLLKQVSIKQLSVTADNYEVSIKGKLRPAGNYRHDLSIRWQASLPSSAIIKGQGQLKGDIKSTRLKQKLSGPLQLSLDAQAKQLLEQLNWTVKVNAKEFDISKLAPEWPALSGTLKLDAKGNLKTATMNGQMKGQTTETGTINAEFDVERLSNNSIQIKQLKIHTPQTDTRIETSGNWLPGTKGGELKLALNWLNLRWPMQQPPWFNSATGNGTIEGNIDHYEINMSSDSPWPDIIASTWHANATGNLQGLNIHSLRVSALEGEALANGQLRWSPELNWKANISAHGIDPAGLLPQWPGKLNAKATSNGSMHNGQLLIDADIKEVNGQLRSYPVSLQSGLQWHDNSLNISQLRFNSGQSRIKLDGQIGKNLKLRWRIDSTNLAELYPQAKGKLQAHGKLNGPQKTPLLEATVKADSLAYPNYEIGAIEAELAIDMQRWQKIDIQLSAKALRLSHYKLQTLEVNADNQQMQAKAVSRHATARLTLKGQPYENGWRGHIEQADVTSEYYDHWQLQNRAELNIGEKLLHTKDLCWRSSKLAELCTTVDYANAALHSHLELKNLPLKLFRHWLPDELKLEGVANGTAEVNYLATEKLLAEVDIQLPPGAINYPMLDGESDRREYRGGHLRLSMNPQGLTASSRLTMANNDDASARLQLPGFKPLAVDPQQPLKADARLNISDLKLIENFVPEIYEPQGELKLKLDASGTIEQPRVSGDASMVNASVQIPRLGLSIKEISLNALTDGYEKFSFHMQARSGDGTLAINGQTLLDRRTGWATDISITGDEFEAARIPEARIQVSPDLQVNIKNRNIDIKGKVHIPYAKLQPKDITQAAKVSSDTVIIGGEQKPEEKWLITTAVRLTLGERVHFYGFGFEGRLGGSLLLEDEPGQLTKATGEINIPEGNYRAYGQRLEVVHGRAIYTGSPLTNPGLDLRAVRQINEVTAGLNVTGTLNQLNLEIFSSPTMGQTDALAYLLLGRPLETADNEDGDMMAKAALALGLSGGDVIARSLGDRFGLDEMRVESGGEGDQAALVVGRYLSPRLYASYGVGLIESINTLTLRYYISNKWQIKAESGEYQGADILYTIER